MESAPQIQNNFRDDELHSEHGRRNAVVVTLVVVAVLIFVAVLLTTKVSDGLSEIERNALAPSDGRVPTDIERQEIKNNSVAPVAGIVPSDEARDHIEKMASEGASQ